MVENPVISVIIPCYNVAPFVDVCLNSILTQKYSDIEIICVNDGSTDGTLAVLQKYKSKDSRITVISQVNGGLSSARNTGMEHASGEWIMFVDADDWLEPDCIEDMLKNTADDLLCFSYNRVFEQSVKPRKLNLNGRYSAEFIQRRLVGLVGDELSDPTQADSLVTAWGKLYKNKIIKVHRIQFIDTRLIGTEDALFNIEYLNLVKSVFVLDKPLYNYRKSDSSSLTLTHKADLLLRWKNLYSRIAKITQTKDPIFQNALQNRICLGVIGLGLNETFADNSFSAKRVRLRNILSEEMYKSAFTNLDFKYFPLHWKVFFTFAKYRLAFPLLIMLLFMKNRIK